MEITPRLLTEFWSRVEKTDTCWVWKGSITEKGYGRLYFNYGRVYAHRVSYLLAFGKFPDHETCHTCDNRACVNPSHLQDGTHKENMRQMSERGRVRTYLGEKNGNAKLLDSQREEVREMLRKGMTQRQVARHFGVSQGAICQISRKGAPNPETSDDD